MSAEWEGGMFDPILNAMLGLSGERCACGMLRIPDQPCGCEARIAELEERVVGLEAINATANDLISRQDWKIARMEEAHDRQVGTIAGLLIKIRDKEAQLDRALDRIRTLEMADKNQPTAPASDTALHRAIRQR